MAVRPLKTVPDPMAFINGSSKPEPVTKPEPVSLPEEVEEEDTGKSKRFLVALDGPLLARLDRERKRRGGIGRSTLLRMLAAEHLPE